jgi:xanthine/CO dehydrogenase XdhC/CoxF family maturation factor
VRLAVEVGSASVLVEPDEQSDVVLADHDRPEVGEVLREALAATTRWIGIIGNPKKQGPHMPDDEIARAHRPIGRNIGSRTPAEIAVATLAGLIADRKGRPGGFF